jgi:hypothetical protein
MTGAFVIGTAITGGLALASDSTLQDLKRTPGTSTDEIDSKAHEARGLAIGSDVMLGLSIVSAGLATYFTIDFVMNGKKEEPEGAPEGAAEPEAAFVIGPGAIGVTGKF